MTNPPQGSDEPDRFPTEPTPTVPPPAYEGAAYEPPAYPPPPGQPPYEQPSYGPPGQPSYGAPAYPPYGGRSGYGQPQPYGAPPQFGTPPYGAPYGPPPAAPARKSKIGLIAIATGILLLAIAGVVVLVLSQQSTVLDPSAVERDVAAQFEQREGVAIELDCSDTMKVRAGATYTCRGTTADGEPLTLKIAITDPKTAAYTWTEP